MNFPVSCPGCGAGADATQAKAAGFIMLLKSDPPPYGVSTAVFVCPTCTLRVKEAAALLHSVFGTELSRISMPQIARLVT